MRGTICCCHGRPVVIAVGTSEMVFGSEAMIARIYSNGLGIEFKVQVKKASFTFIFLKVGCTTNL